MVCHIERDILIPKGQASFLVANVEFMKTFVVFRLGLIEMVVEIEDTADPQHRQSLLNYLQRICRMIQRILNHHKVNTLRLIKRREILSHAKFYWRKVSAVPSKNVVIPSSKGINIMDINFSKSSPLFIMLPVA